MRTTLRVLLGLVLIGAGVVKLLHPLDFLRELQAYALPLPLLFWRWTAACFPWFESICGAALMLDLWAETIRPVAVVLFALFCALLSQAILRGLTLNCGCFGSLLPAWLEQAPVALLRAVVLLAVSVFLLQRRGTAHVAP